MPKTIHLTRGYSTTVDDDVYEWASKYNWQVHVGGTGICYATRYVSAPRGARRLHREIMGVNDPKVLVDHKDCDGLNNLRDNLRICTASQNNANTRKRRNSLTSSYKGVSYHKQHQLWRARLNRNGVFVYLAYFDTELEAAKAYDEAALKHFGEFARINFEARTDA